MTGIRLLAMFTDHFRKHKNQGRPVLFTIEGKAGRYTLATLARRADGTLATLREVQE